MGYCADQRPPPKKKKTEVGLAVIEVSLSLEWANKSEMRSARSEQNAVMPQ